MENRLLALVTLLSLSVGLVFGSIAGALFIGRPTTPDVAAVKLDPAEQEDFIIAAAEAYAGDHDLRLAQDRLARVHSKNITARVEYLAIEYALQRDLIAKQLAGLALGLGSHNITVVAMNLAAAPAIKAQYAPLSSPLSAKGNGGGSLTAMAATSPDAPSPASQDQGPPSPTPVPEPTEPLSGKGNGWRPAPTATRDLVGVQVKQPTPTRVPTSSPKPNTAKKTAAPSSPVVRTDLVNLPDYVNAPALSIPFNAPPSKCTDASQMPDVVDRTIALCPNQDYLPFQVDGNNITIYGDPGGSALIHAPGRAFGITVTGSNITITGVHIEAETDPADMNTWLCLYDECNFKGTRVRGATNYGGGILLDHTTNVAVISSTVSMGTIGVASLHGSNNKIVDNDLLDLNGWGVFLSWTDDNTVVGNTLNNVARSCMGPDGKSFTTGCESAGIAAIKSGSNLFVNNHCDHSSNCVYASGDGGFSSNNNKFFNNYCAASPHNCFEITFSTGNQFDYNVATADPNTGDECTYPFWISGSNVDFGPHNKWNCKISAEQAFTDSQHATEISTAASGF